MIGRAEAWGEYWRDPNTIASLGDTDPETRRAMDAVWLDFARHLPARSRLLDLATGNGIALRTIRSARKDLDLTGVDSAPTLPKPPPGIRFKAGAVMEALPFPDARFGAVTSRFGIEYGDRPAVMREAARVMRGGARLRFMIHHADSVVLRHNLSRLAALRWAAFDSGWPVKASNLARGRQIAVLATPDELRRAPEEALQRYSGQRAGWEFITAIVQTLDIGLGRGPEWTLGTLAALQGKAQGEIARLEALREAACDHSAIEQLRETLAAAGVVTGPAKILGSPRETDPLAWLLDGQKQQSEHSGSGVAR